jgi:hypothetical protein
MINFDIHTDKIESIEEHNPPLIEAIKELKSADRAYERMIQVGVGSFFEYEAAWRDFLHAIDRVWNKTAARCKNEAKWPRLKSKYEGLRKSDPLLKYIVQARNVSEHTISPVVKDWDAELKATQITNGIRLNWKPWDRPLLPVTNRGTTFLPPKKHLGKPMSHYMRPGQEEPKIVAECAMYFYLEMLNEVGREVFKS